MSQPPTGNPRGNPAWQKGMPAANPGGRPKKFKMLQARCVKIVDTHVVDAWEQEVISRGEHWVQCSVLLVHYAYGKPKEKVEHSGGLSLAQLIAGHLDKRNDEEEAEIVTIQKEEEPDPSRDSASQDG